MSQGESVLIHAGWSSIGQAAITLALHFNCTVFTTVANEEQKNFLKQKFPQVNYFFFCLCIISKQTITEDIL